MRFGQVHTRTSPGAGSREYLYDELTRLSQTIDRATPQVPPNFNNFHYDDIGNITTRGSLTSGYRSDKPHLLDLVGDNAYFYDASGNVRSRSGSGVPSGYQRIDYTPFNLPSRIVTGGMMRDGAPLTPEVTTRFEYSADQERLLRRDEATSTYFVSKLYQRKADYVDTTNEQRFRIYAGGRAIGEIVRTGSGDRTVYFQYPERRARS